MQQKTNPSGFPTAEEFDEQFPQYVLEDFDELKELARKSMRLWARRCLQTGIEDADIISEISAEIQLFNIDPFYTENELSLNDIRK